MALRSTQELIDAVTSALEEYMGRVSNAEVIGALEMVKLSLWLEDAMDSMEEDSDDA